MSKRYFTDESLEVLVDEIKSKQNGVTGNVGQIVGFDSDGNLVAMDDAAIFISEDKPSNIQDGDFWCNVLTVLEAPIEMFPFNVLFNNDTGFIITPSADSKLPVYKGESYSFTVSFSDGYEAGSNFAVKSNGNTVNVIDGVYTINNIRENQSVTVEGVALKTYTISLPSNTVGYTVAAESGYSSTVTHGGDYKFRVNIASGYEASSSFAVKANGTTLTASNGVYTISNITSNRSITVEGVTEIKTIVNVTGTGSSTYCYATINGTKRSSAVSNLEVKAGDTITFGIYGRSTNARGTLTIDGTQVLSVNNQQTQTYNWTIPEGVKTITINMSYTSSTYQRKGIITVTTAK